MIKTIVISGPESSGKTWLAERLATHYSEPLVAEYSREYLANKNGEYTQEDLIEIAKGQSAKELKALSFASKIIIQDTGILDIKVWSLIKYGNYNSTLSKYNLRKSHTFHLLCAPNIAYVADALRENPSIEKREEIFRTFNDLLEGQKSFLGVISEPKEKRLKKAIKLINSKINY